MCDIAPQIQPMLQGWCPSDATQPRMIPSQHYPSLDFLPEASMLSAEQVDSLGTLNLPIHYYINQPPAVNPDRNPIKHSLKHASGTINSTLNLYKISCGILHTGEALRISEIIASIILSEEEFFR